jgi:uncharacterized protein YfiM (DUF2279 family)
MKTLILLLLTATIATGQIKEDKVKHFIGGAFVSGTVSLIVYDQTKSTKKAFLYGIASGVSIGIVKEVIDEIKYKGWDNKDLLATVLGSITITIPLNFWEKNKKENE